jgi:hypothetical protein
MINTFNVRGKRPQSIFNFGNDRGLASFNLYYGFFRKNKIESTKLIDFFLAE